MLTLDIPSISDPHPPQGRGWGIAPGWDFPQVPVVQTRPDQTLSAQVHIVGTGLFREEGPEEQEVE